MPVGKKMTKLVRVLSVGLVLAVVLTSLFLPAQQVTINGIGTLSVGEEVAYASPAIAVDAVSTSSGTGNKANLKTKEKVRWGTYYTEGLYALGLGAIRRN